jgi:hypothetical protein
VRPSAVSCWSFLAGRDGTGAKGVLVEVEAKSVATGERRMVLGHGHHGLARLNGSSLQAYSSHPHAHALGVADQTFCFRECDRVGANLTRAH